MYDEMLMMIFSFFIKQIMNKIICHKENLKQTTRDHHCKWVKWTPQTQQTTSHKIEANTQIQHHTLFKKSTIVTWSLREKVKTKYWNSTTTTLSHMRVKETFSNSTTPIITRQWSKSFKFNMTTSSQECQTNHFKIQWPYHQKKVKQTIEIQHHHHHKREWRKPFKLNTNIIMTREWNKPFKFDNNNIIIQEQKKPFELNTNIIIIITRNWNKLLKLKNNMIILKRKLKHTI